MPTLPLEILDEVPLNLSSFIPPLLTVEFINQLNTSQILLVTMLQFFGTLSPSKKETVPLSHLSGNTSKQTFSTLASQLSLLPSRSHPQTWYTDLERPSTLLIRNDFC